MSVQERNWCVYRHTFPDGMLYIGLTSGDPFKRWANGYGYKGQQKIYEAIVKYGWNNIKHEVVKDNLTENEAYGLERDLIEAEEPRNLYNSNCYKNGREKIAKKDLLDYCVGAGISGYSIMDYVSTEQEQRFKEKIKQSRSSFHGYTTRDDGFDAELFYCIGKILYHEKWSADFPPGGVTLRRFGEWLADEAEFTLVEKTSGKIPY